MSTQPESDADFSTLPSPKGQRRRGMRLWEVLLVLGIIAVLVAMLLPARRTSHRSTGRLRCSSNLHQIALGVLGYQQAYHHLPPAATVDARGRVLHSWRTLILPFIDEQDLYESIDLTKPWDDPVNARARQTALRIYHCPNSPDPKNTTTYLGLCGLEFCFSPTTARPLSDITDGHATTLMAIEAPFSQAIPWMQPTDADAAVLDQLSTDGNQHHVGGFNALFVDGSVRFLGSMMDPKNRRMLATIHRGETLPPDLYAP